MPSLTNTGTEPLPPRPPTLVIAMGVSGCGKSTLGSNLASALGMPFRDGDDLHPASNVEKMSRGEPLTDADREPWLALIRKSAEAITEAEEDAGNSPARKGVVIACSALKKYYRDLLRGRHAASHAPPPASDLPPETESATGLPEEKHELLAQPASHQLRVFFVYIHGEQATLEKRMAERKGHFMKVGMLRSQLATLEDPRGEEGVVSVLLEDSPEKQAVDAFDGVLALGIDN